MRYQLSFKLLSLSTLLFSALCLDPEVRAAQGGRKEGREERPPEESVAVINGRRIGKSEADAPMASQIQSLEQKIYELRSRSLEALIGRVLLEEEATRRGITLEELRRQVVAPVRVEEKEVEETYNQNFSRYGPPPLGELEARERIRATIESQKRAEALNRAINELKAKARIEVLLKSPEPLTVEIDAHGPSLGAAAAPVTIAAFVDFQCQYCKQVNETLKQILQSYGSQVRILHKNLPLPNHSQSFRAAQAAYCAGAEDRFWQYHNLLFEHAADLSEQVLKNDAAAVGLDPQRFGACLDSEASRAAVTRDLQEARRAGIFSTPTFVINGRVLKGAKTPEDFKAVIDQSLKERKTQRAASAK
jgi:protein-disulfide isomerase